MVQNIELFNSLYKELVSRYVDTVDTKKAITTAIDGLLYNLDPYTTFIPEEDTEDFESMTTGEYGGIGSVIMQWAVNVLGSTAVAAVTAAGKTSNLLSVPLESLGTAMATYAGQNLGAARLDRVRSGVRYALGITVVYAVLALVLLHFFDVAIIGMFIDTGAEVEVVSGLNEGDEVFIGYENPDEVMGYGY